MEQTVGPARKILGEVRVPGELQPAEQALVLAAVAEGESRIRNAPPALSRLTGILEQLGVPVSRQGDALGVEGRGLRGFTAAGAPLDLEGMGDTALLLVPLLAGQAFSTRVRLGTGDERVRELIALLGSAGAAVGQETESVFAVGGAGKPTGVAPAAVDVDPALKLAVLVAGLYAEGTTSLRESPGNRSRMERFLRQRQVVVERRRQDDQYLVSVAGGQAVQACDVEVPGDLRLAYPLLAAALVLKGSELKIRRVALRSGQRAFLDLVRQIGAAVEIEDLGDEVVDLTGRFSVLKSTRVAGQRAARVIDQIPLLAVLATQARGEFVIRDLDALRQEPFDYVAYLFEFMRRIEARVGEFPEGIVIKGGFPLQGARIDGRGDPGLVMALAVAGLLAESEMVIEGTECLDGVYPDFFPTLHKLKERRR